MEKSRLLGLLKLHKLSSDTIHQTNGTYQPNGTFIQTSFFRSQFHPGIPQQFLDLGLQLV